MADQEREVEFAEDGEGEDRGVRERLDAIRMIAVRLGAIRLGAAVNESCLVGVEVFEAGGDARFLPVGREQIVDYIFDKDSFPLERSLSACFPSNGPWKVLGGLGRDVFDIVVIMARSSLEER